MPFPTWTKHTLAALILATQFGCQTPPSTPTAQPTASVITQAVESQPISEQEGLDFLNQIVDKIAADKLNEVNDLFDYETFLDTTFGGLKIPTKDLQDVRSGFREGVEKKPGGLFNEFAQGDLKVLKFHQNEGFSKGLLRMLDHSGAVSYLEFYLRKDSSGSIKVYDIYSYATGEEVSQTVRRLVLPLVSQLVKTPMEKLVSGGPDLKDFQKLLGMMEARKAGDYQKGVDLYNSLPDDLKTSKPVLIAYLTITMEMDDDEIYLEALETFKKHYADDPAMLLHSIDYHFLKKDFEQMMGTIDKVEESLGVKDPYLDVMRASGYMESKDFDKALEAGRRAGEAEPTLEEAHWVLVRVGLESKDYDATVEGLNNLKEFYPDSLDAVTETEEYSEFFQSPQGKKWRSENN